MRPREGCRLEDQHREVVVDWLGAEVAHSASYPFCDCLCAQAGAAAQYSGEAVVIVQLTIAIAAFGYTVGHAQQCLARCEVE